MLCYDYFLVYLLNPNNKAAKKKLFLKVSSLTFTLGTCPLTTVVWKKTSSSTKPKLSCNLVTVPVNTLCDGWPGPWKTFILSEKCKQADPSFERERLLYPQLHLGLSLTEEPYKARRSYQNYERTQGAGSICRVRQNKTNSQSVPYLDVCLSFRWKSKFCKTSSEILFLRKTNDENTK